MLGSTHVDVAGRVPSRLARARAAFLAAALRPMWPADQQLVFAAPPAATSLLARSQPAPAAETDWVVFFWSHLHYSISLPS